MGRYFVLPIIYNWWNKTWLLLHATCLHCFGELDSRSCWKLKSATISGRTYCPIIYPKQHSFNIICCKPFPLVTGCCLFQNYCFAPLFMLTCEPFTKCHTSYGIIGRFHTLHFWLISTNSKAKTAIVIFVHIWPLFRFIKGLKSEWVMVLQSS